MVAGHQVGSLDLLFNVTGLVRGVGAGLADLFQLPLSGLSSASLSAFVSGVWSGWASLFSHVSGWTLTSVGGFSASVARLLKQVRLIPMPLGLPSGAVEYRHREANPFFSVKRISFFASKQCAASSIDGFGL
jgi:hypothetical protein